MQDKRLTTHFVFQSDTIVKRVPDKRLVTREELVSGKRSRAAKLLSGILMNVLGLDRANELYSETYDAENYTGALLSRLDITYTLSPQNAGTIPKSGPVIVLCNHPTGAMDGIILIDLLSRIRPDVKFMGNFLLDRIEPLRKYVIAVDPFDSKARATNMKGLKLSMEHLASGGMLALFPAGEVATWQKGFRDIKDKKWEPSAMKFVRRSGVPVLPLFIEARNSTMFRLMGKIDPRLRTAMLPHELFNKKGSSVRVISGTAVHPSKLMGLNDVQYSNYLRASVDYLAESAVKKEGKVKEPDLSGIAPRPPRDLMEKELTEIAGEFMLYENDEQALYCAPTGRIPNLMAEIGRLREITFRQVGEGTMKESDIDKFDGYYRQLILWDKTAGAIMGGYRMGFGDEIMEKYGIEGFYTDTLFRYRKEMAPVLAVSIELGRSFLAREYQRRPNSLLMLWKGILYVLLKHQQFRNMIGPVTISGEFTSASKMVIATWLRGEFCNSALARYVRPVNGMKGIETGIDLSLIEGIRPVELIARLVADLERDERMVPVLVKKYLGVNSSVLGFNVDPDFADGLDALMLLDMKRMPDNAIAMLSKELEGVDVAARFRRFHTEE